MIFATHTTGSLQSYVSYMTMYCEYLCRGSSVRQFDREEVLGTLAIFTIMVTVMGVLWLDGRQALLP